MPLFAGAVIAVISALWSVIQAYLIAKLVMRVLAVGLLFAAWTQVKTVVDGAFASLVGAAPAVLAIPMTWVIPQQFPAILSVVLTVEAGLLAYRWTKILFGVRTST